MHGGEAQATGPSVMIKSFIMGGPGMQKFSGVGSEAKLGEWKLQIETMLCFQPLSDSQKADFVLELFEEEAKRKILILKWKKKKYKYFMYCLHCMEITPMSPPSVLNFLTVGKNVSSLILLSPSVRTVFQVKAER